MSDNNAIFSKSIKAGKTCYFIDVREAKNANKYLSITEAKFEGEERKRKTINIFGDGIHMFREAIDEAVNSMSDN